MIPLKLETLLKGRVVEQNRVEYKRGWNPSDTIHTICAFANDFQNVNGGYIVIGIESENGIPLLPPYGIKMEAKRFFSYPYGALEEILVNATFHKLYRQADPVEIRVYVDHIMFLNYPGPAHWIDMEEFVIGKAKARSYRNRRIGEFLKEIDLSEKQCTGIIKILRELEKNGSPPPEFRTDEGRNYLIVTVRIRDGFKAENKKSAQKSERTLSELLSELLLPDDYKKLIPIITHIEANDNIKPSEAEALLGKSPATIRRYLGILVDAQVLIKQGKSNNTIYIRVKS